MNILIIGGGGREHAMTWKIKQSPLCTGLFVAPGNAGTAQIAKNISVNPLDFDGIKQAVLTEMIDFVIVGPDDPLGLGIVDFFKNDPELKLTPILGPTKEAAQLESSKDFAKNFMVRHHIPTAAYRSFTIHEKEQAINYISAHELPVVIKADGLSAGKGVAVCNTHNEALDFVKEIWGAKKFGHAGDKIVVESFLDGIELSVFILTDGQKYILLPEAKDYKRIGEGDTGANTGGMGSISPVPFNNENFMHRIIEKIIDPTIRGLKDDHIQYRGFIFFGLIKVQGEPYVIEYNARLGDPETQVIFPRIKSDIVPQMLQAASGTLSDTKIEIANDFAASVIAVSGGYPDAYEQDKKIEGTELVHDSFIFHAGTKLNQKGELLTSGGRVIAITSLGGDLEKALETSYKNIAKIRFEKITYRHDIGLDVINLTHSIHKI